MWCRPVRWLAPAAARGRQIGAEDVWPGSRIEQLQRRERMRAAVVAPGSPPGPAAAHARGEAPQRQVQDPEAGQGAPQGDARARAAGLGRAGESRTRVGRRRGVAALLILFLALPAAKATSSAGTATKHTRENST